MENIQNQEAEPKENLQEEEELLKLPHVDEVKKGLIDKFGLNEELDGDLINKLIEEENINQRRLATAIKQKRTWREKAESQMGKKEEEKPQMQVPKVDEIEKLVDQRVSARLEERELESLSYSDKMKDELKSFAKANGFTIKQAMGSDYFSFLKSQEESRAKVDEASIGGKRKAPTKSDFASKNPSDFDLTTEEGRADYEKFKEWRKKNS